MTQENSLSDAGVAASTPKHDIVQIAEGRRQQTSPMSWLALTLLLTNLGLAAMLIWAWFQFGSIGGAVAFLRGDRLVPDAYSKSFGTLEAGESATIQFLLTNVANEPIKVVGASTSCTCVVVGQIPATVQPRGKHALVVTIRAISRPIRITESVRLFTDLPGRPFVDLNVGGRILMSPKGD